MLTGYTKQYIVGKGSFGEVYKGTRLKDGRTVAIKEISKNHIKDHEIKAKLLKREEEINKLLSSLKCPFFVEFLESV